MPDSTTIAHISDVHITPLAGLSARHLNVKRTLGLMNWHRGRKRVHRADVADLLVADMRATRPHHVAVTGDLCNIGLPNEYAVALQWLENVGPPDAVTVVPGNHDIYTRMGSHPGVGMWCDYMMSDAFGEALPGVGATPLGFPFVRRVGSVALVGVNSAVETRPFVAAGRVGVKQLEALEAVLHALGKTELARVVLIHHPPLPDLAPESRALRDAGELAGVLARTGAELVLHGHNHRDMLSWGEGPASKYPVLGIASGSAGRRHREEPLARYNLVRVRRTNEGWAIEVTGRGLISPSGGIVEIDRHLLAHQIA